MKKPVIVGGIRTPIGSFLGSLKPLSAPNLASIAMEGLVNKYNIKASDIDEVILGQVLQGGVGQAPARQASLGAGFSSKIPATTVNKVCGSGLKAVIMAAEGILAGSINMAIAGGMESMSNAPFLLQNAREGFRMGPQRLLDLMLYDGLFDPYGQSAMGGFGDICAKEFHISREMQDEYAKLSYEKAIFTQNNNFFDDEIIPVKIKHKNGDDILKKDEEPKNYKPEKMLLLRPAFNHDGTVTAANASKINDGAAVLALCDENTAKEKGFLIKANIVAWATNAQDPQWFTTAPIGAIKKAAVKASIKISDIGLFEINEAFSVVPLVCIKELSLDPKIVNIFGGAVALGHPIGASGARILVTLINAMQKKGVKYGCAAICLGGGEALSMIIERPGY